MDAILHLRLLFWFQRHGLLHGLNKEAICVPTLALLLHPTLNITEIRGV